MSAAILLGPWPSAGEATRKIKITHKQSNNLTKSNKYVPVYRLMPIVIFIILSSIRSSLNATIMVIFSNSKSCFKAELKYY